MNAETIAKAIGGRKVGSGWTARCPAHDDKNPSLSVRNADGGKVLARHHAGCDQDRVIAARNACAPTVLASGPIGAGKGGKGGIL
jgi:putative DNA primase/helicase